MEGVDGEPGDMAVTRGSETCASAAAVAWISPSACVSHGDRLK